MNFSAVIKPTLRFECINVKHHPCQFRTKTKWVDCICECVFGEEIVGVFQLKANSHIPCRAELLMI